MKKFILPLLLLLILSFFSIAPLLKDGYFTMHDDTQVARVFEMKNSLEDGMLPVRWVENLGFGYGYPIFNFYAPLPYYIGGVIDLLGADSMVATKIMFGIGVIFSGITMFFFLKRFFTPFVAVTGGLIYLYFPYHAVNVYIRGAVGEYFAYAFLPLVFLAAYSLHESAGKYKKIPLPYTLLLSCSVFLVTVSHNLSAFMMIVLLAAFAAISVFTVKYKRTFLVALGGGILLGIGLSAFYFLPAILESRYTNVASQVGAGADYKNHFVCISQYWNSMWGFGGTAAGCIDGVSFKLGKQNILLFIVALVVMAYIYIKRRKIKNIALINAILAFVAILLTLSVSKVVWDTLPFMPYLQYPWRFINFIGLFFTFSIAYLLFKLGKLFGEKIMVVGSIGVILATLLLNAKLFTPQNYRDNPSSYYTNTRYIHFDVSKLTSEYMPKNFEKPKRVENLPVALLVSEEAQFTNVVKKTQRITADYASFEDAMIHVNIAYYPAWHIYVNGKEMEVKEDSKGMNISVPKGAGKIEIEYQETPAAIVGNIMTLGSFITVIAGIIFIKRTRKHGK